MPVKVWSCKLRKCKESRWKYILFLWI